MSVEHICTGALHHPREVVDPVATIVTDSVDQSRCRDGEGRTQMTTWPPGFRQATNSFTAARSFSMCSSTLIRTMVS